MRSAPPAMLELDAVHRVVTPEYVEFDFVLAGLLSRFLAWLIDTALAFAVFLMVAMVLSLVMAAFPGFASTFVILLWFLIDWGYFIFFEVVWTGQTVGKRALGLRVIQESGVRVGFFQSALRNLARPVDRLPLFYLVGGAFALFSEKQQRLGDMLGGTVVIRERRLRIPAGVARPEGDTALLDDPAFRARVATLSAEEEAVLLSAAMRREELGMEARLGLFAALSARLQEEHGFEKPAHLSDEKLVLLTTAALAAQKARAARPSAPRQK